MLCYNVVVNEKDHSQIVNCYVVVNAGVKAGKERGSSRKRKGIESDEEEESPPRKAPTHRRMAMVYDSDED